MLNQDLLDGKSDEDMTEGRLTHIVTYSTEEDRRLAEFIAGGAGRFNIDLDTGTCLKYPRMTMTACSSSRDFAPQ